MKIQVLLINPSISSKTQNPAVTEVIRCSFPMSLGHIAGYLEANGYPVRIHDEQLAPLGPEEIRRQLNGLRQADTRIVVGLTTLTVTSGRVYELARMFKEIDPDVATMTGGIHASVLPQEGLDTGVIDFVVRGEGELTTVELLQALSQEGELAEIDVSGIAGISYRKGSAPVHNPARELISDLSTLPPFAYHLFEKNRQHYSGFSSIQSSRGCPHACIFCSQRSLTGKRYRTVSQERVLGDIDLLVNKYGATTIRFLDDNIAASKKHIMPLLSAIVARKYHTRVSFEAPMRGDNLDEELLDKLKAANFSLVTFGLETGSEQLMKVINKGETVAQVVRAIRMTAAKGITVGTTLIFGLPTETRQDRWRTIRLVVSLPLDSARFNILTPYPDTPLYKDLMERGEKVTVLPGWINFSVQYMWENDDLPYVPPGTDKYELILTTMFANLAFYLRPQGLRKLFTKSVAGGNVVHLPKRWYMSKYLLSMLRVLFYLLQRFLRVGGKMILRKLVGSGDQRSATKA